MCNNKTSVVTLKDVPFFAYPLVAELVEGFGKDMTDTQLILPTFTLRAYRTRRSGKIIVQYEGKNK